MNQKLGKRRRKALNSTPKPGDPDELVVHFQERHYFPEERHHELENALIAAGMAAPLIKKEQFVDRTIENTIFVTSSHCISYVRASLEIDESLHMVVSEAARNAVAIGPSRCFAISVGTVRSVANLAINLYQSKAFRDIWEPGEPLYQLQHQPLRTREEAIAELQVKPGPVDLIPQPLLGALISFATEFTAFHELGHLVNGHCTLIRNASISEIASIDDADQLLTRRALEFDADAFAVLHSLRWTKLRADDLKDWHHFLVGDDQTSWITMITAVLLVIIAMDRKIDDSPADHSKSSHPPPHIRAFDVMAAVSRVFQRWKFELGLPVSLDWKPTVQQIRARIELAIGEVGQASWDREKHDKWMDVIIAYDTSVLSRYAKLRDLLVKGKLGKRNNLAPAQFPPQ